MSEFTNRLISEKSPYLLQHASNPVDWYPWGEEAFEKARNEDRPIFLSIGYATCHWCHVMEKESFTDPSIAQMLNDSFVNIKVDREELPEVDNLYMEFAQALMSNAGGWPLNVILTPDLKPFFAVTYLPPKTRKGLIGMDQFVKQITMLWQSEERNQLTSQADKIVEVFEKSAHPEKGEIPTKDQLEEALETLFTIADPIHGGIKGEPKFPLSYQTSLFLQESKEKADSRPLYYIELTLSKMARGAIYDQLGGGFSRYAVDEKWQIPHFEKMLYDNALLSAAYLEGYKYLKNPLFAQTATEICDYVLREMTGDEGGFFSAEDADTDGQEGKFYTWNFQEILEVLGLERGEVFCRYFNVSPTGNFDGTNVLFSTEDPAPEGLEEMKKELFERRKQRNAPFKDDKVITSWNGLMITSLAKIGHTLGIERFTKAAIKAAQFIKDKLYTDGVLHRRFREGESRYPAGLDDHAFLISALITLFELGEGKEWLEWAILLEDDIEKLFATEAGAYYHTRENPHLLVRKCEFYDGAEPSGIAMHAENLIRLFQLTGKESYLERAEGIFEAAKNFITSFPPGAAYHLIALKRYYDTKAPLFVIALDQEETLKREIQDLLLSHFSAHQGVIWKKGDELDTLLPLHADKGLHDEKTSVYICRGDACLAPLTTLDEIKEAIETL